MNSFASFLKLLNFEITRLSKFLFALITLTVLSNMIGAFLVPRNYMNYIEQLADTNNVSLTETMRMSGGISLSDALISNYFTIPQLFGVAAFLIYLFFIWYREWFGKNTFVYRLMMLPQPRMSIFFSKVAAVLVGIWGLVSVQYLTLYLTQIIIRSQVLEVAYTQESIVTSIERGYDLLLPFMLGNSPFTFIAFYGVTFVFILCVFTIILLERCYKLTGILAGVVYGILALLLIASVFYIPEVAKNNYILFPTESLILIIITLVMITVSSVLLSRYLINNKLTV